MMNGWVKMHRQNLYDSVFINANLWQVYSYCLMSANYQPDHKFDWNGEEKTLRSGQFICGRIQGAKDCHMKPTTFYYQLNKLEKLGYIDIESNNKYSVITIKNWDSEQGSDEKYDNTFDNGMTTNRQQNDTFKNKRNKERKNYNSNFENKPSPYRQINESESYLV